ncbi:MAG: Omp28-related outer membrane protein [Candidatus Zixiibacteriota bacterium]|nr:MAG: Omp28-related outer membrane protein [candidate division Zixibacteria bacterium]
MAVAYQGNLALVRYHYWWPDYYDPFFQHNIAENTDRINYYGSDYAPHFIIDGIIDGAYNIYSWDGLIADRVNVSSPLTIDIDGNYDENNQNGEVTITIFCETTPSVSNLKLRVALTESDIQWQAPNGSNIHNQTFRDMIPNTTGEPFSINQGDTRQFTYQFEIRNPLVPENCGIMAFVQSDQNREILQGSKIGIPDLIPLDVYDNPSIPNNFALSQNYPNPFNAATRIDFHTEGVKVKLAVYDVTGSLVKTLVDGSLETGSHSIVWDGKDNSGSDVSSGVYFYRLSDSSGENVRRMTLLR